MTCSGELGLWRNKSSRGQDWKKSRAREPLSPAGSRQCKDKLALPGLLEFSVAELDSTGGRGRGRGVLEEGVGRIQPADTGTHLH